MFPRSTWSNLKSFRENLSKLFWMRGSKLVRVRAVKCPMPGQRCSTTLMSENILCKAGGCVFQAHFSFIAKFSWKQRRFSRRNSEIMTSIFSYLHNTDCLPNLLSHSDLSKSGKNTQDGRSWTRARITCQNTDQNFTSACSSPCLKSRSFQRYKAKPGLLPSAIYSLSRNKSRHHKNFTDCTFSRLKLKWVMTG